MNDYTQKLGAVAHACFLKNIAHMGLHRRKRNGELITDFRVTETLYNEFGNFMFPFRKADLFPFLKKKKKNRYRVKI